MNVVKNISKYISGCARPATTASHNYARPGHATAANKRIERILTSSVVHHLCYILVLHPFSPRPFPSVHFTLLSVPSIHPCAEPNPTPVELRFLPRHLTPPPPLGLRGNHVNASPSLRGAASFPHGCRTVDNRCVSIETRTSSNQNFREESIIFVV